MMGFQICLGKGLTGDEASEDAAVNGLKLLYKLNLVPEKLMGLKEAVYERYRVLGTNFFASNVSLLFLAMWS